MVFAYTYVSKLSSKERKKQNFVNIFFVYLYLLIQIEYLLIGLLWFNYFTNVFYKRIYSTNYYLFYPSISRFVMIKEEVMEKKPKNVSSTKKVASKHLSIFGKTHNNCNCFTLLNVLFQL